MTSASEQLHKGKEMASMMCLGSPVLYLASHQIDAERPGLFFFVFSRHAVPRAKGEAVTCLNNVSSCTGHLGDDGLVCATPSIQQAAFTHIGSTNQGYLQMHSTQLQP